METLRAGERFPELQAAIVGGERVRIPDDLSGFPAVLVFYRGHW